MAVDMANMQSHVKKAKKALEALAAKEKGANADQVNGNLTLAMNAMQKMAKDGKS